MKNYKNIFFAAVILTFCAITFSACHKIAKPTIIMTELGHANSYQAEQGDDLHVEAEVVAEGRIANINIEIHQENDANTIADTTFTEFAGLKNCTFHKHISIPEKAPLGTYHFHFTVIDQEGNSATFEEENLQIIANDGIENEKK